MSMSLVGNGKMRECRYQMFWFTNSGEWGGGRIGEKKKNKRFGE